MIVNTAIYELTFSFFTSMNTMNLMVYWTFVTPWTCMCPCLQLSLQYHSIGNTLPACCILGIYVVNKAPLLCLFSCFVLTKSFEWKVEWNRIKPTAGSFSHESLKELSRKKDLSELIDSSSRSFIHPRVQEECRVECWMLESRAAQQCLL